MARRLPPLLAVLVVPRSLGTSPRALIVLSSLQLRFVAHHLTLVHHLTCLQIYRHLHLCPWSLQVQQVVRGEAKLWQGRLQVLVVRLWLVVLLRLSRDLVGLMYLL